MSEGNNINIAACFVKSKYGDETELEIKDENAYQLYKAYNLLQAGTEFYSGLEINLKNNFQINVQNLSKYLVISLEINEKYSGKLVYSQSVAQFGVIGF